MTTVSTARVLFVTGKGGVGKTTVAGLLAKAAGIGGRPARLIDTCGRSDDGSDDRAVVEALITRLVGLRAVSRRMLDSRSFQALLAAIPGLVDVARLDAIRRLSKKERVVVDGPASGQAAAMAALFAAGSLMGGERGADRRRDAPMIRLKPPPITLLTDSTQIIFFNLVALS